MTSDSTINFVGVFSSFIYTILLSISWECGQCIVFTHACDSHSWFLDFWRQNMFFLFQKNYSLRSKQKSSCSIDIFIEWIDTPPCRLFYLVSPIGLEENEAGISGVLKVVSHGNSLRNHIIHTVIKPVSGCFRRCFPQPSSIKGCSTLSNRSFHRFSKKNKTEMARSKNG